MAEPRILAVKQWKMVKLFLYIMKVRLLRVTAVVMLDRHVGLRLTHWKSLGAG